MQRVRQNTHIREQRERRRNDPTKQVMKDPETGRFLKGNKGGGRFKGSRNKLSEEFLSAMLEDFTEHGKVAIARARRSDPLGYIKVIAGTVAKHVDLNVSKSPVEEMDDDELRSTIRELDKLIAPFLAGTEGDAAARVNPPRLN